MGNKEAGAKDGPTPREDSGNSQDSLPDDYANLDELADPALVQNGDENPTRRKADLKDRESNGESSKKAGDRRPKPPTSQQSRPPKPDQADSKDEDFDMPDNFANLDELADLSPVENPDEDPLYVHKSLEEAKSKEQEFDRDAEHEQRASVARGEKPKKEDDSAGHKLSKLATQLYVISYLILFSILGTLARLGLQALTFYPGAPLVYSVLWANFGGSLCMGFLAEDRMLFKNEWGTPTYHQMIEKEKKRAQDEESGGLGSDPVDPQAAQKAHAATKKTIPLYIGLATGFCGSFTSFSSFIRDAFLAMSNKLPTPLNHPEDYGVGASTGSTVSRNGGYSFMALLAVIIVTITISISGLFIGAHIAIAIELYTPSLPFKFCRKILDRIAVLLAFGCWLGAVFLAIFPPDRHSSSPETWRGRAVFALVFAPLGCLGRFYASIYLNGKIASFPLGTFVVNIFGTAIIGMSYDLQHVPFGGVIGCQVLQGVEDGFCGCLTTVSTWVSELTSLRRRHAYRYGAASVIAALCFLIVIMGGMQWTVGFGELKCTH